MEKVASYGTILKLESKNRIKDVLIREYNKLNASGGKPITNGEHDER